MLAELNHIKVHYQEKAKLLIPLSPGGTDLFARPLIYGHISPLSRCLSPVLSLL